MARWCVAPRAGWGSPLRCGAGCLPMSDNPAVGPLLSFDTDNDGIHDYGRIVVGARIDETGPTHICLLGERGLYKLRRR